MEFATEDYIIKRTYIKCFNLSEKYLSIYTPTAEIHANIENFEKISCDTIVGNFSTAEDFKLLFSYIEKNKCISIYLDDGNDKTILSLIRILKSE